MNEAVRISDNIKLKHEFLISKTDCRIYNCQRITIDYLFKAVLIIFLCSKIILSMLSADGVYSSMSFLQAKLPNLKDVDVRYTEAW